VRNVLLMRSGCSARCGPGGTGEITCAAALVMPSAAAARRMDLILVSVGRLLMEVIGMLVIQT
jgi:hypothetical protein